VLLLHQALHDLLGNADALLVQRRPDPAVTLATVIRLEDIGNRAARLGILLRAAQLRPMIKVGAAGQVELGQQLWKGVDFPEGINQPRLLPVSQELQVDAQAFF
jgi:hypothetical protein